MAATQTPGKSLAALRHKEKTGEGQQIDVALVDCQIAGLVNEGTNYLLSRDVPKRRGNQHPNIVPYQVFDASDGHLFIAVGNDAQYRKCCVLLKTPELAVDAQYATNAARLINRTDLAPRIAALVKLQTRDSLISQMEKLGIPCGPVHDLAEVFASDQVRARGMKVSIPDLGSKDNAVSLIGNPIKMSKPPSLMTVHPHVVVPIPKRF